MTAGAPPQAEERGQQLAVPAMTHPHTSMSNLMLISMPPARKGSSAPHSEFRSPSGKMARCPPVFRWASTFSMVAASRSLSTLMLPRSLEVKGTGRWPMACAKRPSTGRPRWVRAMRVFVSPTRCAGMQAQMMGVSSQEAWFAAMNTLRPLWPALLMTSRPCVSRRIQQQRRKARRQRREVSQPMKRPLRRLLSSLVLQQPQRRSVRAV
mmetsp:Transcript_42790/g.115406  ORF Transcript_42790/g.115406 Transcript_42790/m.115406 type:complete len:209 (-) Transcript_42790:251-877(-)